MTAIQQVLDSVRCVTVAIPDGSAYSYYNLLKNKYWQIVDAQAICVISVPVCEK